MTRQNHTPEPSENLKKLGELLAFMIAVFIVIGALSVFGIIGLKVMLAITTVFIASTTPSIIKNYTALCDEENNLKKIAGATMNVFK